MAEHVWSVLCRKGVLDNNNTLSLIDVCDKIIVTPETEGALLKEGEGIKIPMQLVNLWIRSDLVTPERFECRVVIATPNGRRIEAAATRVSLEKAPRNRLTIQIEGVPFYGAGLYNFIVQQNHGGKWRTCAKVPLEFAVSRGSRAATLETGRPEKRKVRKK